MKKVSTILLVLMLALSLFACGGTEMEDQGLDVETKQIATMDPEYGDEDIPWQYKTILDTMEESDVQFFFAEVDDMNNPQEMYVYQTNAAEFNGAIEKFDAAKVSKDLTKELEERFSYKFEDVYVEKQVGSTYYNGYNSFCDFIKNGAKETLYDYYHDNQLNLSSENWQVTKLAVVKNGYNKRQNFWSYYFLAICEGDVTTDAKSTDSLSIFPEAGASTHMSFKVVSFGTTIDKEVTIEDIFFE